MSLNMNGTGVYWLGQDGNVYVKGTNTGGAQNIGSSTDLNNIMSNGNDVYSMTLGKTFSQIADPNAGKVQAWEDPNALSATRATSTNSNSTSTYDPTQLAVYDQGINTLNSSLNRLPGQLDIAKQNIDTQYGVKNNELNSSEAQAKNTYDTQGVQNQQSLRTNRNTITDQASQGLRGLMRTLGAHNALGSSDLQNATGAVQGVATAQNNGAGSTFADNQKNLDTNWGNFGIDLGNKRKSLNDWRDTNVNSTLSQSETTKQSILNSLAQLSAQRAAYKGGNAAAAAQPYLDQANSLSGSIDSLAKINPTYNGTTPVYTAPSLSSYNTGNGTGITTGQNNGYQDAPALAAILGLDKKKQQQPNY